MPTVAKIKDLAESMLNETSMDESIDSSNAIKWVDECLRLHISSKMWLEETYSYSNAVAGSWYSLPYDFIRSVYVTLDGNNYSNYVIRNRSIKFSDAGSYVLCYVYHPEELSSISADIPVQEIFLFPMAKFVLARHLSLDPERKNTGEQFMMEFQMSLNDILGEVEYDNEPFQIKEVW